MPVPLETPSLRRTADFLEAVHRSRSLHRGLVSPPRTREQYRAYVARPRRASHRGYLVYLPADELAGVVNVNEIVRGLFQSAYLGFYTLAPYQGRGHMRSGLALVIARFFGPGGLHRLEANI